MASIYKKIQFFKVQWTWDTKTVFPTTYKLQSNDFSNKRKVKFFKDHSQFGTEFLLDKMINKTMSDFLYGADRVNLDYIQSFGEFSYVLQGAYLTDWKQVCHEHFPKPINPLTVSLEHNCSVPANF